jgi:hypothetical protein
VKFEKNKIFKAYPQDKRAFRVAVECRDTLRASSRKSSICVALVMFQNPFFLIILFSMLLAGNLRAEPGSSTPAGSKATLSEKSNSHLDLVVTQTGFSASEYVSEKELKFQNVCSEFAKFLTNNRGLWGTGPFRKVVCFSDGATVPKSPRSWRLEITGNSENKKFDIFFIDASGASQLESTLSLETELTPTALLSVKRTRAMIAAVLTLGMPFRSIVKKTAINQDSTFKLQGFQLSDLPPPETSLQIFSLNRTRGLWLPKVVGTAEINQDAGAQLSYKVSLFDPTVGGNGRDKLAKGIYYLQQSENRDEERSRVESALKQDLSGFLKKLVTFARAVYIGGRYGQPLGRSKGVLSQAATVGVFGEFRGGLFQGIKFNYDAIPLQETVIESAEQKFSWSRIQLGYGFGRRFNNILFNWIDLTPKIGVTSMEYSQGASDLSGDLGFEFKLQKAPTLGAEIGIEKRTPYFLARLWSSGSYSVGILQKDKKYKSSSVRVGFDVYRDLFALGSIKVALLGFGAGDASTFTRSVTDAEIQADPNLVTNLKYQSVYAGGGLTLTW